MGILQNPKILYFTRILQFVLSVIFLILICYSGTHRQWWTNINGALALGVITSIATLALCAYGIFSHYRRMVAPSRMMKMVDLVAEVIFVLLWCASVGLMFRHKGVRPGNYKTVIGPPWPTWIGGEVVGIVEIITFILSTLLKFTEERTSKVGGGSTYV